MPEQKFKKIRNKKPLFAFNFFDLLRETNLFFILALCPYVEPRNAILGHSLYDLGQEAGMRSSKL